MMDWTGATCAQVDPEIWFPEKGGSSKEALAICRECPIRAACLAEALAMGTHDGIWGGVTSRQRRSVLARFRAERPEDPVRFAERSIMELEQLDIDEEDDLCAA